MGMPLKISFCTTCKERLPYLQQTLPANLRHTADYPNAEFVILDYGSSDGLADWIKSNHMADIESGRIRYARHEAEYFKVAHAKNMAHRLATGKIVCNLDADNIVSPDFAPWLNETFAAQPESLVRMHPHTTRLVRARNIVEQKTGLPLFSKVHSVSHSIAEKLPESLKMDFTLNGAWGRIALAQDEFLRLRGYDERYRGWGNDDDDLHARAVQSGLKPVSIPWNKLGAVLGHTDSDRIANLAPEYQQASTASLLKYAELGKRSIGEKVWSLVSKAPPANKKPFGLAANPDGLFGCGEAIVDFGRERLILEPVQMLPSEPPTSPKTPRQPGSGERSR